MRVLLIIGMFILFGCSEQIEQVKQVFEPRIDTRTDETMGSSIKEVHQFLSDDEKFLEILAWDKIDLKNMITQDIGTIGVDMKLKNALNGKNAGEVIQEADRIIQILKEIDELETKWKDAEFARIQLAKFEVIRSRFYIKKEIYVSDRPMIEITVNNGTHEPVSYVYFKGIFASPNRSTPWIVATFNHAIPCGLEPGEQAKWSLYLYGDEWRTVNAPSDAILTVEVEKLDDVNGKILYSTRNFNKEDLERLNNLYRLHDKKLNRFKNTATIAT